MLKRLLIVWGVSLSLGSSLRAETQSADIFPASMDLWINIPDVRVVKDRLSGGNLDAAFRTILDSSQWKTAAKNLRLNDSTPLESTGLYLREIIDALEGELAWGIFQDQGVDRWCLFVDPRTEIVAIEILRSNMEKKLTQLGCVRIEKRVDDCDVYCWMKQENCVVAYTIRDEKLLASNSSSMVENMAMRWVRGVKDGLSSDPEFGSSSRAVGKADSASMNLFFRNQMFDFASSVEGIRKNEDIRKNMGVRDVWFYRKLIWKGRISALDPYGLLPVLQSDVTSTYASLQFPDRSKGVEFELKIQINTPHGDKFIERPGAAEFPKTGPYFGFDVVSYSVLSGDFWKISDYLKENVENPFEPEFSRAKEQFRELLRKHGLPEERLSRPSRDSQHFHPVAYRCQLVDGSSAVIFKFRDVEKSRPIYSKGRFSSLDKLSPNHGIFSTSTHRTKDIVYFVETPSLFKLPANSGIVMPPVSPRVYGILGDYYVVANSEKFFTEHSIQPEESLDESISFRMVKTHLGQHFSGNAFAVEYWDLARLMEESGLRFEESLFSSYLRLIGGNSFDELFRKLANDFGPVGGSVGKNTTGFRLNYFMLIRR
ncbi:hypothetical protein SH449x_003151 [Pirellulaceae bacterium SH449]